MRTLCTYVCLCTFTIITNVIISRAWDDLSEIVGLVIFLWGNLNIYINIYIKVGNKHSKVRGKRALFEWNEKCYYYLKFLESLYDGITDYACLHCSSCRLILLFEIKLSKVPLLQERWLIKILNYRFLLFQCNSFVFFLSSM